MYCTIFYARPHEKHINNIMLLLFHILENSSHPFNLITSMGDAIFQIIFSLYILGVHN